ncbi:hypothetical protein ACUNG1_14120 [Serratia sp. IR-2025]
MSETLLRKELRELRRQLESEKAERDALAVENAALKDVFGSGEAVVNFLSKADELREGK